MSRDRIDQLDAAKGIAFGVVIASVMWALLLWLVFA